MTDNSSDTPNGIETGLGEPSMEDILASIRRIIAEDDNADQGHVDIQTDDSGLLGVSSVAAEIIAEPETDDVLVLDELVQEASDARGLELDARVEDLEIPEVETEEFNPVSSVMSDLEDKLSEDRSEGFDLEEVFDADSLPTRPVITKSTSDEDEDPLLDVLDLTSGRDEIISVITEEMVNDIEKAKAGKPDPLDDILTVGELDVSGEETELASELNSGESDLDIVKSLMADLTDTSFLEDEDEDSIGDDLDAESTVEDVLADIAVEEPVTEVLETAAEESEEAFAETSQHDEEEILSDILDLTLQDEEALALDSLDLMVDDASVDEPVSDGEASALLQIAAAAQADAENAFSEQSVDDEIVADLTVRGPTVKEMAETEPQAMEVEIEDDLIEALMEPEGPTTEELLSELDLALAEVTGADIQDEVEAPDLVLNLEEAPESNPEPELEFEMDDEEIEAKVEELIIEPEESEDMARTARKDTIIDEVTETATAGAFAELNQAVEQKAVLTESGPRVGDIVQDALRPMLKEWLDENLKGIVERAVAKEVKRISSGK